MHDMFCSVARTGAVHLHLTFIWNREKNKISNKIENIEYVSLVFFFFLKQCVQYDTSLGKVLGGLEESKRGSNMRKI